MKIVNQTIIASLLFLGIACVSCGSSKKSDTKLETEETQVTVNVPTFHADSAYQYVADQVAFGPRVPNSDAHKACGDYLAKKLEDFGAKVYNQYAEVIAYDGTILKARNIVGAYNTEAKKRVMLCAHWDTRPYSDNGEEKFYKTPIDGANDGASGVGILLEIARQLQQQAPTIGIDLVLFDAEDYGTPQFYEGRQKSDTWCLGSQYWARIPHVADYKARYGILLDMVGGKNATFYYEGFTQRTANSPMKKIWKMAHKLGHNNYFFKADGGEVTDDHVYVNRFRQIPCVDIIDFNPNDSNGFNHTWHTQADNMDNIDRTTLQAVGETVLHVIYHEK